MVVGCLASERLGRSCVGTAHSVDAVEMRMFPENNDFSHLSDVVILNSYFHSLIVSSCIHLCVCFFQDDSYDSKELANLKSLVSNLHQILDLHKEYDCRLSLSVFEKV